MGIGIQDQFCAVFLGQFRNVPVRQAVSLSSTDFQINTFLRCHYHFFLRNKTRVGQDVNVCSQSSTVGTRNNGLCNGFSVDHYDLGPQRASLFSQRPNMRRGDMRQLDAGYGLNLVDAIQPFRYSHNAWNDKIQVGGISMVRDTYCLDTEYLCPVDQFRWNQDTIAENRMGVEINHDSVLSSASLRNFK